MYVWSALWKSKQGGESSLLSQTIHPSRSLVKHTKSAGGEIRTQSTLVSRPVGSYADATDLWYTACNSQGTARRHEKYAEPQGRATFDETTEELQKV